MLIDLSHGLLIGLVLVGWCFGVVQKRFWNPSPIWIYVVDCLLGYPSCIDFKRPCTLILLLLSWMTWLLDRFWRFCCRGRSTFGNPFKHFCCNRLWLLLRNPLPNLFLPFTIRLGGLFFYQVVLLFVPNVSGNIFKLCGGYLFRLFLGIELLWNWNYCISIACFQLMQWHP